MTEKRNAIPKDYFSFERRLQKLVGISINEKNSLAYKIYSLVLLTFMPYAYLVIATIEIITKEHSAEESFFIIIFCFGLVLDSAQIPAMLIYRKKLNEVLTSLQKPIFLPNVERGGKIEEMLIKDCVQFNTRLRNFLVLGIMIPVAATVTNTVIKRLRSDDYHDWEMGFGSITLMNSTRSPNFEIMAFYQELTVATGALQYISFNLVFMGILSHICVQFQILQNHLKKLAENAYKKMLKDRSDKFMSTSDDPVPIKYLQEAVREVVTHHLSIIDLTNKVEEIYNVPLFAMYITSTLMICLDLYLCTIVEPGDTKLYTFISGIISLWCQFYYICYWCDNITRQSLLVGDAAYSANFVGMDLRIQKDLIFIIRRSLKPTTLTAAKLFDITLTTFMKIQQAAYSFLMIMRKKQSFNS